MHLEGMVIKISALEARLIQDGALHEGDHELFHYVNGISSAYSEALSAEADVLIGEGDHQPIDLIDQEMEIEGSDSIPLISAQYSPKVFAKFQGALAVGKELEESGEAREEEKIQQMARKAYQDWRRRQAPTEPTPLHVVKFVAPIDRQDPQY